MLTSIISGVIVGLIVAGLAGTVATVRRRRAERREIRHRESSSLRNLIFVLARKRALIEPQSLARVSNAGVGHSDFDAVTASIFNVRQVIDETRLDIRDDNVDAHAILDRMSMHCNDYLHASRHDPEAYLFKIHDLRDALIREVGHLRSIEPDLPPDGPGSKAYGPAQSPGNEPH